MIGAQSVRVMRYHPRLNWPAELLRKRGNEIDVQGDAGQGGGKDTMYVISPQSDMLLSFFLPTSPFIPTFIRRSFRFDSHQFKLDILHSGSSVIGDIY